MLISLAGAKLKFWQALFQSSVSHDPSERINSSLWTLDYKTQEQDGNTLFRKSTLDILLKLSNFATTW